MKHKFIKNFNELVSVKQEENAEARRIALTLLEEGLRRADPKEAVREHLKIEDEKVVVDDEELSLVSIDKIYVIGAGKASGKMAEAIEEILGSKIHGGTVIVPRGTKVKLHRIEVIEGSHPIPSAKCIEGAMKILEIARKAGKKDLIIALISGGGSSLLTLPAENLTLNDIIETTKILLKCGADIKEINAVRKHISKIKGGQLAKAAYPAKIISLIISDVVGDPIDAIASGPTAPDPTTFRDAWEVLEKYNIADSVPPRVKERIIKGLSGNIPETPKPGDPAFFNVKNLVIASNIKSLKAMSNIAGKLGLNSIILTSQIEGEARHVGLVIASILKEIHSNEQPIKPPAVVIAGGETTVTVTGNGIGGRNQELALSAATSIKKLRGVVLASIGSDGIDGITNAAGAIVDGETIVRAERLGLNPNKFLVNNDSYTFFKRIGKSLIFTGYTGTNINDLIVGIVLSKT